MNHSCDIQEKNRSVSNLNWTYAHLLAIKLKPHYFLYAFRYVFHFSYANLFRTEFFCPKSVEVKKKGIATKKLNL